MGLLEGSVAFITGGASGIGEGMAREVPNGKGNEYGGNA